MEMFGLRRHHGMRGSLAAVLLSLPTHPPNHPPTRPQVNVGKGGPWLFPFLCESLRLTPSSTAVVGDRLDTDIALARERVILAILPHTGGWPAPKRREPRSHLYMRTPGGPRRENQRRGPRPTPH